MDIAKKLREVVTANFIEIVRSEEDQRQQKRGNVPSAEPPRPTAAALDSTPASTYPSLRTDTSGAIAEAELKARRELDELEALLDAAQDEEGEVPLEASDVETPDEKLTEASPKEDLEEEDITPVEIVSAADKTVDMTPDSEEDEEEEEDAPVLKAAEAPEVAGTTAAPKAIDWETLPAAAEAHAAVFQDAPETPGDVTPLAVAETAKAEAVTVHEAPKEPVVAETPAPPETVLPAEPEAKKVEVAAKQEVPKPETAPVIRPAQDPILYLNSDGTVDFARLLRDANLPTVAFGAEQARKLMAALPEDLPMRVKRMTVKATLDAISPNTAIDTQDIVADAMLRRMHVAQFRDTLGETIETTWRTHQMEIDRLEAEIDRLKTEVATHQLRQRSSDSVCNQQIAQLEQVILFFQTDEALVQDTAAKAAAESDDVPPFMRDESVYRLLGMNSGEPEANPEENGESNRRGRRR